MLDPTSCPPRALLAVTLLATTPAIALAGKPDQDQPTQASAREDMATVRVALPAGDRPSTVEVVRRHGAEKSLLKADASWFGVCLADRKQLEAWRKSDPQRPERRLWERALRKQGYEALVVLRHNGDGPRPACSGVADGMSMKHTDVHPGFRSHVKQALTRTLPSHFFSVSGCPILD